MDPMTAMFISKGADFVISLLSGMGEEELSKLDRESKERIAAETLKVDREKIQQQREQMIAEARTAAEKLGIDKEELRNKIYQMNSQNSLTTGAQLSQLADKSRAASIAQGVTKGFAQSASKPATASPNPTGAPTKAVTPTATTASPTANAGAMALKGQQQNTQQMAKSKYSNPLSGQV